ncbi:outer membrane lipoprotein-sorting protein [Reinekea marina]|uniref:Outer membrane lipoprotein-sorting protein n=1 Tax=Reinekea marina TaxID=1310421 RepID=A0ABV7WUU0_9GAMM|nr:outer membrane lipoprotein-sorting protein [Reinekea marina]MDN3647455.1 outer membrane lipoprotein-sorting protein [Reinekea marina]
MKKCLLIAVLVLSGSLMAMTADEIMSRVDQVKTPSTLQSNMTMILVDNKGKQRIRAMQSQSADMGSYDASLLFFLEPADVKGTGFLMKDYKAANEDDDQWMFLPSLGKAKRIAGSDKTGSFMGSDFSYADMSKRNLEDWQFKLLKEDEVNDQKVWVIEALPVSEAVVEKTGYVKTISYVRQDNFLPIRGINYLEKKGEVKLLNVAETKLINGYWINTKVQMISQKNGKTVHRTQMSTTDIIVDANIDQNSFTLNRLEQGL